MKILVVSQYFWPEDFRINDICKGLKEEGHEVTVLTGLPNYPFGKLYDGYSFFNRGEKEYEGIKIKRCAMIPRGKDNAAMLALNYISFMINASVKVIPLLFVFQVSPITSAIPAIIYSKVKKVSSYIYIQDLWPETFYSIININNSRLRKVLKKMCNKIYDSFDNLLIASRGYEEILLTQGVSREKLYYLPQWAEDFYSNSDIKNEKKDNRFTVTFAGNIGKAQSVDTIIKAANLAKDNKDIIWQIIGDGSEFENVKNIANEFGLTDTVRFIGRKPSSEMPKYFSESQGLIVTLRDEEILRVTLPAKVQSYMAAGKPILAAISGEGKKVIEESKCGLVAEAEDFQGLYKNVIKLYNMNIEQRRNLGKLGKEYFNSKFTRTKLLQDLKNIITK